MQGNFQHPPGSGRLRSFIASAAMSRVLARHRLEPVPVPHDQDTHVTGVHIGQAAIPHRVAVGPVTVHDLMLRDFSGASSRPSAGLVRSRVVAGCGTLVSMAEQIAACGKPTSLWIEPVGSVNVIQSRGQPATAQTTADGTVLPDRMQSWTCSLLRQILYAAENVIPDYGSYFLVISAFECPDKVRVLPD